MFSKKLFVYSLTFLLSTCLYSKEISIDELRSLSIEELLDLEIYSAGKAEETLKEIPASVYMVNREEIKRYGYRTLSEILENVPGMYNIYSYNGASGNFGIRGFWNPKQQNSSVVILINGVRQYYFDSRSSPMEQITVPIEAIDRVEVIRGPNAVIYGNGASFGVINIVTNEVTDTRKDSLIAYTYGSLNTQRAAFRLALKENELKLVLNSGFYKTDGLDNKYADMMSEEDAATLPAVGVSDPNYSTDKLLEQENRYFNINGSYKEFYFDFAHTQSLSEFYILYPSIADGSARKADTTNVTLGYTTDITSWIDINAKGTYYRHNRKTNFDAFTPDFFGIIELSYDAYDVELLSNIKPHNDLNILLGLNYTSMNNLDEFTDITVFEFDRYQYFIDKRETQAIFTQLTYQATKDLRFILGIRYEELKEYSTLFIADSGSDEQRMIANDINSRPITSPRFATIYNVNETNILKLLFGKSSRIVSDSHKPEETTTIEANYLHYSTSFYTSFSIFQNSLTNLLIPILEQTEEGGVTTTSTTSGELSTIGTELIINANLTDSWIGEIGITYQKTYDVDNRDFNVAYSPDLLIHVKTSYSYRSAYLTFAPKSKQVLRSFT